MKFKNLDKRWKELLFAASGFGPNLLMVLMGAFFTDAVNPSALDLAHNTTNIYQTITGTCLVVPGLFSILWFIGKVFDGVIDIPFASVTDNLKTKWGRRRLPIVLCFIPMVVSYILCWIPISETSQIANSIWFFAWSLIFFATYTMNLIAFYGSLSTVCCDDSQRLRVSSLKSFFDTISYCLVYALVPVILSAAKINIATLVFILSPLMVTILIPVFMIKEGDKFEKWAIEKGYDITPLAEEENVKIGESIKLTFTNKPFISWTLVNCCTFFGLQMFLVSMNALILGGMGLNGTQMAILNTCAFAPVPIMLYLFNKLKKRKGIRFTYQSCLLCFAVCILSFFFGSTYVLGDDSSVTIIKMVMGCVGGIFGSWAIGSFFMMPLMVPAQISSVEEKLTKKNHSAMYFAAQALTTSVVGAVASSLVYENIKNLFISKAAKGVIYAEDTVDALGNKISAITNAATSFGVAEDTVFNLGTILVPFIVSLFCILGFFLAFRMLKNFSPKEVAKELHLEKEYEENKDLFIPEKGENEIEEESLIVQNGLWVLSGTLFSFITASFQTSDINKVSKGSLKKWPILLCLMCPIALAVINYRNNKQVNKVMEEKGLAYKKQNILVLISSILMLNCISQTIIQKKLNTLAK